jgi:hypothetical protein
MDVPDSQIVLRDHQRKERAMIDNFTGLCLAIWIALMVIISNSGCVAKPVIVKGPIVEVDRPVELTFRREGFDTVKRRGRIIGGTVFVDGEPVLTNFQYAGALVKVQEVQ